MTVEIFSSLNVKNHTFQRTFSFFWRQSDSNPHVGLVLVTQLDFLIKPFFSKTHKLILRLIFKLSIEK